MKVIPAVDIKGGKCVQLVGGKPGTEQVEIEDVLGVARKWQEQGAEMLHVIDLDSALGTGNNESLIEMIVGDLAVPVQVGGGIRTEEKVRRLFEIGCERVIVGTRAVQDREFIRALASKYPGDIIVAIDSASEQVLIKGWQESSGMGTLSVVKDLEQLDIWGFLYTNVEVEGKLQGINPSLVKGLMGMTSRPVIVSGGFTTIADLELVRGMGVDSVVLGMSIYTGKIDFKKAVREFR
jgi:phosphoribosylformimino-5-aminoimidazole carboxamide ribotide isomerase